MAKGNMFLGMSRGSVGDVTFYRSRGNQIARARNRYPKNPKSTAQVIQRMILATASKAYSRMKSIVDHSFQGISYGADSQSYFLRRAMNDIRTFVAANLPAATETNLLNFRGLAEPTSPALAGVGLLISEGSLPSVPANLTAGEDPAFDSFGSAVSSEAGIADVMTALGAVRGDQITIVALGSNGQIYLTRYVINADATSEQLAEEWDGSIDPLAFDQVKSALGSVILNNDNGKLVPAMANNLTNVSIIAGSIILSRKDNDSWLRSTQRLIPIGDIIDVLLVENGPDVVLPIWEAGTAVIDTTSPYYLNQAEE